MRLKKSESRFLYLHNSAIKLENGKMKNGFSFFNFPIKIGNWKLRNFYHFSIFNFEVKIEICKNVLFHFNFELKIKWHFRCTDFLWSVISSKLPLKNESFHIFSIFQKIEHKTQVSLFNLIMKTKNKKNSNFYFILKEKSNVLFDPRIRILVNYLNFVFYTEVKTKSKYKTLNFLFQYIKNTKWQYTDSVYFSFFTFMKELKNKLLKNIKIKFMVIFTSIVYTLFKSVKSADIFRCTLVTRTQKICCFENS